MKNKSTGTTGKRFVQYALYYKKMIILALFMLAISVAAELAGPFIAKTIIDDHIVGIETPWVEVAEEDDDTVPYNGELYKREEYVGEGDSLTGDTVRVLQVGMGFYFLNENPPFIDGTREVNGNMMTITQGEDTYTTNVTQLSTQEVVAFFAPEMKRIVGWMVIYFGLLIFASFFQYGQRFYLQKAANRIIYKMRNDVFQHLSRLPVRYFDNLPAGKVVSRVTNDTEAIRELYVQVLANFFSSIVTMIGIFIALFLLEPTLAAMCLVLIPILLIWIKVYRSFASKYNHVIRSKVSEINAMVNESIQGMPIIQAFRRENSTKVEFEEMNEEHFKFQNKMLSLNALTSHNLTWVLRNLVFVGLIWYFGGATLGVGTVVTVGVLYAFVDYINRLFEPINGIVNQLANLELALVAGERVFELMEVDGTEVHDEKTKRIEGNVAFENVTFGYKAEEPVLHNISFAANKGETVALIGHTGSGKSSILNLLFRFYDPQVGCITIDGENLANIPRQTAREHMGIVLQDPYLFTGTILSNITLNDPRISRERAEEALRAVGGDQVLQHAEKGLDEPVVEKGSTLSAGQRQLISFARALAFDPAILILDEATSNIDTETESIIQHAMDVLKEGRTTFVIAHRLSTIREADQILVLDRGQIVERGSHENLMQAKGKYFAMYQLQKGEATKRVEAKTS
ncbi:ABC transporter ATP-binding protein [Bacillus fonticola]|uniref:ABC transporter ATP-binding protein n=1 Tax=Bacillus fonticola TaxID=2728853 RepID=UPI001472BAD7|nr:ABC transporter ATP-binding protein [Bacillus fonticola]